MARLDGHYGVGPYVWRIVAHPRRDAASITERGIREVVLYVHTTKRNRPCAKAIGKTALHHIGLTNHTVATATVTREENPS